MVTREIVVTAVVTDAHHSPKSFSQVSELLGYETPQAPAHKNLVHKGISFAGSRIFVSRQRFALQDLGSRPAAQQLLGTQSELK